MKGWAAVGCGILVLAVAVPAGAAARRSGTTVSYGTSCIDGNNNGVCGDSADTPLAQALDANTMYLDGQHGSHSGLVLSGGVSLPTFIYVQVTKNIVVSGPVKISGDDVGGTIQTLQGNITVAPGTAFNVTDSLSFETISPRATIDLGAGGTAQVSGDTVDLTFKSQGVLHVGTNQQYSIRGGGYADVNFYGLNGLQVDPVQSFRGVNHGAYYMNGGSDLTLDHVNWKAGYVMINVTGSDTHPGPRHLTVTNSTLNQIYKNGNMKIYADTDRNNGALGSITIDHSTLIAKDYDGGILNPMATCIASTAPSWACG